MLTREELKRVRTVLTYVAGVSVVICIIILLFFRSDLFGHLLAKIVSILTPFIYGGAIAYLLRPLCLGIERLLNRIFRRGKEEKHTGVIRVCAIVISLVLMFLVIVLLIMAVLPELVTSITVLIGQLPDTVVRLHGWIGQFDKGGISHEIVFYIQNVLDTLGGRLENFLQTDVLPNLESLISSLTTGFMGIINILSDFLIGCIISAYLLGSWEKFTAQGKLIVYGLFPKRAADWIRREVHYTDKMFGGFIHGKLLDSLIIGVICFIFVSIVNMPYGLLVSVIVGVTNIIPFFGPYLGAIPSALLILTVSPGKCILFVVFIIILQQIDGNVIGPTILGDRLGISAFWILFSILIFSSLWGVAGMILGVPCFGVIYDLIRRYIFKCLRRRKEDKMIDEYHDRFGEEEKEQKKTKKKEKKEKKKAKAEGKLEAEAATKD